VRQFAAPVRLLQIAALLVAGGCAHTRVATPAPGWRTLSAEQRVTIDYARKDGARERKTVRAVVAVEQPDRFRLRALGPAGVTLFDLVSVRGRVTVVESLRDPSAPELRALLASIAGDVSAAYDLEPRPPDRVVTPESGRLRTIREPERIVHVSRDRFEIDNRARNYRVTIETARQTLDAPLDPALFADAP